MPLRFRQSIEQLLDEWRPDDGIAALLLEHPTRDIYFPLVVRPHAVGADYYTRPLRYRGDDPAALTLDESTAPVDLALRGRLELTQPDLALPLHQQLTQVQGDPESPLRLVLLRSSPRPLAPIEAGHLTTLQNLLPLACQNWMERAQSLIRIPECKNLVTLAKVIVRRLGDEEQDPPYFPILHADVCPDPDDPGFRFSSANLLSWNCHLLHRLDDPPAYIREMPAVMRDSGGTAWWEDLRRRGDEARLPDSIRRAAAKTVDLVRCVGAAVHEGTTWWAFARHNKDRSIVEDLIRDWPEGESVRGGSSAAIPQLDHPAALVQAALAVAPEEDDVLLTVWLVSADGHGLNVGFRAGEMIEILDNTEFTDGEHLQFDEFAPFTVKVAPLPGIDRATIEERLRPVLESAVQAARQMDGSGLVEMAFDPIRKELHEGAWHEEYPGGGLFADGYHDVADWSDEDLARCHPRMVSLIDKLLYEWTGRESWPAARECGTRYRCWHIRALKALAHDRLHSSLLMAVLDGPMEERSFLLADREICLQGEARLAEVLSALQTVTRDGNRFRFGECHHGKEDTLIVRFSGDLTDRGIAAALVGQGDEKRKGSFTRACESLRRASLRFGVEVSHDEEPGGRWGIVVVFSERGLSC